MSEKRSGEDGILDLIAKYFPNRHPHMLLGRGDDCALMTVPQAAALGNSALFAVTSDIFAENAHFRTSYFTASDIGHKALAVNISDLASNGAKPCAFSFNLTLTERQDHAWLEECFQSMADLANRYDMVLCGGDLTKVPLTRTKEKTQEGLDPLTLGGLNIGITAWGTYEHGGVPLMRHRAYAKQLAAEKNAGRSVQADRPVQAGACMREGDILFRIGEIGLARLGLFLLEETQDKAKCAEKYPHAVNAHLRPSPLVREGLLLSRFAKEFPLFVMDISDGLMRDIPRLLARQGLVFADEKAFGADIVLTEDTLSSEVREYCGKNGLDPCLFAYKGGEDYGLAGVCAKEGFPALQAFCKKHAVEHFHALGAVTNGAVTFNRQIAEEAGFDHFQ